MSITPLMIHNKDFRVAFRGYEKDEVDDFLDEIIKYLETLIKENDTLKDKLSHAEERLHHFENIEETLNQSLIVAQTTAEELKHSAEKESKLIVREAKKNADHVLNESLSKARKIAIEIEDLKRQSKIFRERLRMLVEAQMELIKSDDWQQMMSYDSDATELTAVKEIEGESKKTEQED